MQKLLSNFHIIIKINMIFPLNRNKSIRSCNDCALDRNQTRTKKSKSNAHHQIFSVSWHRTKVTFLFALAMMNASTLLWTWPQMVEMHFPNCYFYYAAPAAPVCSICRGARVGKLLRAIPQQQTAAPFLPITCSSNRLFCRFLFVHFLQFGM